MTYIGGPRLFAARYMLVGALLVSFALLSGLCRAQSLPAYPTSSQALELKRQGDDAMALLHFDEAYRYYLSAYSAEPAAALLYNLGRASEALGRYPTAIDYLAEFLERAPDKLKARVPAVGELISTLRVKTCELLVEVNVPDARVRVGGNELGRSPLDRVRVNAGRTIVEVSKDGYRPYSKWLELPWGEAHYVHVDLELVSSLAMPEPSVAPARVAPAVPEESLESNPVWTRWWFWSAAGALVAGGIVTAIVVQRGDEREPTLGSYRVGAVTF